MIYSKFLFFSVQGGFDSPSVNKTPLGSKRKIEGTGSNCSRDVDKEDCIFLSTPEKRRLFTEGELADHMTPDPSQSDANSNDIVHKFDTIPEKRKRFRRPSFSRPSFGFFAKRSTPDLRKLTNTPSGPTSKSSSKRARSSSANENDDADTKRRFSFTPFCDRKFKEQRAATERRASKRSNKVCTSSKIPKNIDFESKDDNNVRSELFQCSTANSVKNMETKTNRIKPELRAPLMKIQSHGKCFLPQSMNIRRETLALHKEDSNSINAFRPRRETLATHRDHQPTIVPIKTRKGNFDYERGKPVLESFKPKRDSLLIHKKCQPYIEQVKCVAKDVYEDSECNSSYNKVSEKKEVLNENMEKMKVSCERDKKMRLIDGDVNSPVKFSSFGKKNVEMAGQLGSRKEKNRSHVRRMSTGAIRRSAWTQLKTYVSVNILLISL